ncbi:hypothetical protein T190607A02C_70014 [Tenacibaculum sp. 190524A02b]
MDIMADIKNNTGTILGAKELALNKSILYIEALFLTCCHKLTKKVSPPAMRAANKRYIDCILCIIFNNWMAKIMFLFFKKKY